MLPNWSDLHEFTRGAKTQAGASCILQRHLKVAISKLKCVIQDYMSSQLREDVNCKEELGGQEAEAVVSLPLREYVQAEQVLSISVFRWDQWELRGIRASCINATSQMLASHQKALKSPSFTGKESHKMQEDSKMSSTISSQGCIERSARSGFAYKFLINGKQGF